MKHELRPEVARIERNAVRLLYILGAFALAFSATIVCLELML